jgi:hypothetical protein
VPPESVREAIRLIYVWWGVKREKPPPDPGVTSRPHFLAESPIDWSRKETHELEQMVLTAYPTSTELQALADRARIAPEMVSWRSSGRRITREVLGVASRAGRLGDLVQAILEDPSAVSVHDRLRALVGDAWLEARDL